ncbi:MAG: TlpA family protein disulfide reductase [Bacteroidaceae bacterium]|nr:TlpA family protein disulfide reductase [Bacteroidaceae bacterium]
MKKCLSKKSILFVMLALAACAPSTSPTSTALPTWERKSAPAVILGRYVNREPGDKDKIPGFWGNHESLKGDGRPEVSTDSVAGTFAITWDICYPLKHDFQGWSVMLFPGDTVRVDFNKKAFDEYQAYNRETPRDSITTPKLRELWKKAIHIEGASFELPLPIHMKGIELGVTRDYSIAHAHDTFDEWREVCWNEFQEVVGQLDTLDLGAKEKAYHRMLIEQDYLAKLRNFIFVKKSWGIITDKDSLVMYEKQFTFKDPHAPELTYYRDITGFYACLNNMFDEGREYIQANELEDSPLGRWFKELDEAKAVMAQAKANQPIAESELDALSPEFQVQIREVQALFKQEAASNEGVRRTLPEGAPREWLPKIVAEHKGHIVFVDFWATWCGPCRTGMKAMETVKEELTAKGVDFIYITDTSSSSDEWLNDVAQHAGDHYIVPKEKMQEMQIPDYENAIPHYLIYDREGKLAKTIVGWSGVEKMMQEFSKLK